MVTSPAEPCHSQHWGHAVAAGMVRAGMGQELEQSPTEGVCGAVTPRALVWPPLGQGTVTAGACSCTITLGKE